MVKPQRSRFSVLLLLATAGIAAACHAPVESSRTPVERSKSAAPIQASPAVTAPALAPAEQLIRLAQRDNRIVETVRTISKEHPKRLTGSKGYDAAADWAVERFRSYGLDARLEKWGEFQVAFDRGVQRGRIVAPVEEPLTFATMAWTAGTKGPARGRAVLEPRTEEELARIDPEKDFAGAWIVRTESKEGAKFRKALREAYEKAGILGTLRRGADSGLLTMGGSPPRDPKNLPTQVDVKLLARQYDALVARLEKGEEIAIELEIDNRFTPGPVACNNVVADLRGTEFPDQYVIVQGHFDAWDGAEGAQDNATGSGTALEAARLISAAGLRPRRTIRFVLYSGEEQGLYGSEGYVRDHADELDRVSVVMTHDAGGTFLSGIDATYAMLDDIQRVCAPLESLHALDGRFPFRVHEVDGLVNSGDSDHAPFIAAGVPSFFWHQSEKDYGHVHHTQHDTFEEIDPAQIEHSAVVVAVAALGFANLDHLLDRTDMKPIPRRRLGVRMNDEVSGQVVLQQITADGRAGQAGWKTGDRILAVDGETVATQEQVLEKLRSGPSRKAFRLQRGAETLETVIDYADEDGEKERAARAKRRAEFMKSRARK